MSHDLTELPPDLPRPADDGACGHLHGRTLPTVELPATTGAPIDLSTVPTRWVVLYVYPRTGVPGGELPAGWDSIPGARGCTPQACSYRDDHEAFRRVDASVFGLSTQTSQAQHEFAEREHIPFALLSDHEHDFGTALRLPTFTVEGTVVYKRVTLIARRGIIEHVRYPVFPPNEDASETLRWLRAHS